MYTNCPAFTSYTIMYTNFGRFSGIVWYSAISSSWAMSCNPLKV
nr:MAG TPA: hypothetical protein [Caudoviricetes sp.]